MLRMMSSTYVFETVVESRLDAMALKARASWATSSLPWGSMLRPAAKFP